MSPRSGKVMALFPPHTTDMMSFSPFFFFFFFFLVAAWAAILVCAESLLMGLHADVQTGHWSEGAYSCLFDSLLVRLSAHLSGHLSTCLSPDKFPSNHLLHSPFVVSVFYWWSLASGGDNKQNPMLLILLLFPTRHALWFCGHRQRCSGG